MAPYVAIAPTGPRSLRERGPIATACVFLFLALTGCGLFGGPTPETRYFTLYAPPPADAAPPAGAPKFPLRVAVDDLKIASEYRSEKLAYRPSPYEIGYYNYARWAASPEILVRRALRERLAQSGLVAAALETGAAGASRDLVVEGRIERLEELDEESAWKGRLSLELAVRAAPDAAPFFIRRYEKTRPMAERSAIGAARALSEALDEAIRDFLADFERALAHRK